MRNHLFFIFLFFITVGWVSPSQAVDFFPADGQELQDNLNTAAGNGADDTIFLDATTYFTSLPGAVFSYSSAEDNSLSIIGMGMGVSILDGGGMGGTAVMTLGSSMPNANFEVMGATFQNGASALTETGGLNIVTVDADIRIEECEFKDNTGDFHGGASATATNGSIEFNQNTVDTNIGTVFNGGGQIISTSGPVAAQGNTIIGNRGGFDGGIVMLSNGAPVQFLNNVIENNTGTTFNGGGTVFSRGGAVTFTGNTISENMGGFEGGMGVSSENGKLTANNNIIMENTGATFGGAGVYFSQDDPVEFQNNTVLNNTGRLSPGGGAVFSQNNQLDFANNVYAGNSVTDPMAAVGGVNIITTLGTANIINNTITENSGTGEAGGISIGVFDDAGTANLYNNIIWNNTSTPGMGEDIFISNTASATIRLFNNDFTEVCLQNPASCDPTVLGANQGSNLIDIDPLFVDPLQDDFHLGAGSPVIDQGDPNAPALPPTDHDGNPRILGLAPDLGAFEALPQLNVDPLMIDFGQLNVGDQSTAVVTLSNSGISPLNILGMALSDEANYSLNVNGGPNPCGTTTPTLAAGANCTVELVFIPDGAGSFDAILTITSEDPANPSVQVTLSGSAIALGLNLVVSGDGCSLRSGRETVRLPMILGIMPLFLLVWRFNRLLNFIQR